jgi:hypothetical protein
MRLKGHKLDLTPGTERKLSERSSTGRCECGWEESCSTQAMVRQEYRWHLKEVLEKEKGAAPSSEVTK